MDAAETSAPDFLDMLIAIQAEDVDVVLPAPPVEAPKPKFCCAKCGSRQVEHRSTLDGGRRPFGKRFPASHYGYCFSCHPYDRVEVSLVKLAG